MASSIETIITNQINGRGSKTDRPTAVAAALELIVAKVSNSPDHHGQLEQEMNNLSTYADQIQEALKVK